MNGAVQDRLPADVLEAIGCYLERKSRTQPVSAYEAIQEMRKLFPDLKMSDVQLTDWIAGAAIILNMGVAFDTQFKSALFKLPPKDGWSH
jgi:hypothetical protein